MPITVVLARWGLPADEAGVAKLLELNGMPRWVAFEDRFVVAEGGGKVLGALRYRTESKRLLLGLLVVDPWAGEGRLARALYAGAGELARELGIGEVAAAAARGTIARQHPTYGGTGVALNEKTSGKGLDRWEALLAGGSAMVTVVLWASAFVGIRAAGEDLSPGALSLGRLLVGSAALGSLVLVRRERFPARRDLPAIALCGALWFGLYNVVLNAAERLVDAGTAAMLVGTGPVLIAIFAGALLGEGFPRSLFAGCAVAFAGVVVIGVATSERGLDAGLGAVLCLVAAFAYAGGVVIQKPLLKRVSALQITWLACGVGTISCLPFAPALLSEIGEADAAAVSWVVYLGVFPTAVAFTTWAYALSRTTAGRMGATTYLVPPLAVLMGWMVLGEVPPALALLGGALCLVGVALSRR